MGWFTDLLLGKPTQEPLILPPKFEDEPLLKLLDFLNSDEGEELGRQIATIVVAFFPAAAAIQWTPRKIRILARLAGWALRSGFASGSILPDGDGGFVSKEWAADPRHQLNPDGTFRF